MSSAGENRAKFSESTEYTMSPIVRRYYSAWIKGATLLEHPLDQKRFYQFVKACVRYSRSPVHSGWLRSFLEADLPGSAGSEATGKICLLFEHLIDFSRTPFPNVLVEWRDPYRVSNGLESMRILDETGKERSFYSREQVKQLVEENFGVNWREEWRHGRPARSRR